MNEHTMHDENILDRAKNILLETMNTSWPHSTAAERKLAIYAAVYEVRADSELPGQILRQMEPLSSYSNNAHSDE